MQFPDDNTLLARGKYSTLSKERRKQIERVQTACRTIMHVAGQILNDVQARPPVNQEWLNTAQKCVENIRKAREEIVQLDFQMDALQVEAWGE